MGHDWESVAWRCSLFSFVVAIASMVRSTSMGGIGFLAISRLNPL